MTPGDSGGAAQTQALDAGSKDKAGTGRANCRGPGRQPGRGSVAQLLSHLHFENKGLDVSPNVQLAVVRKQSNGIYCI